MGRGIGGAAPLHSHDGRGLDGNDGRGQNYTLLGGGLAQAIYFGLGGNPARPKTYQHLQIVGNSTKNQPLN